MRTTAIDAPTDLTSFADLVLLRRYAEAGDQSAFAEIVRRYAGVVFAACRRVLQDRTLAEDVTQETFLRLLKDPTRCSQSLGGWLHRSATRLALDVRRSETARRRRESTYSPPAPDPADYDLAEVAAWREISPKIDEALLELPDDVRDVLVAYFLRGRTQADLAAEWGASPATASRRVKAALDALRQELARRGVTVAATVLAVAVAGNAAEAAPQGVALELGKMSMVSGGRLAAKPPAPSPGATAAVADGEASGWARAWQSVPQFAKAFAVYALTAGVVAGAAVVLTWPFGPNRPAVRSVPLNVEPRMEPASPIPHPRGMTQPAAAPPSATQNATGDAPS